MQVVLRPTAEDAAGLAARMISKALREKPDLVLGLATGTTMERLYGMLARMHREEGLDFSLVRTFNLDEYIGLSSDDVHSYHYYMHDQFFRHVNIDRRNTFLPDGMAKDLKVEARSYEEKIERCGGIDVQLLGLGTVGHIGFNEPLSSFYSRTRDKSLTPTTVAQNSRMFDDPSRMPRRALTMGVGTILDSKALIMLVTGRSKAGILAKAIEGPVTSMISATAIQLHHDCRVIVDEEAASSLEAKEYYRWIYENEPEWEEFRGK